MSNGGRRWRMGAGLLVQVALLSLLLLLPLLLVGVLIQVRVRLGTQAQDLVALGPVAAVGPLAALVVDLRGDLGGAALGEDRLPLALGHAARRQEHQ